MYAQSFRKARKAYDFSDMGLIANPMGQCIQSSQILCREWTGAVFGPCNYGQRAVIEISFLIIPLITALKMAIYALLPRE